MPSALVCYHDGCVTETGKTKRFMTLGTLLMHYVKEHMDRKYDADAIMNFCMPSGTYNPNAVKYFCETCARNFGKMKEYRDDEKKRFILHVFTEHFNDDDFQAVYELFKTN